MVTHTVDGKQTEYDLYSFLNKTVVTSQDAPGNRYVTPAISVEGTMLKVVDKSVYLGSILSRTCSLDKEIYFRLYRAANSFRSFQYRVMSQHGIKKKTKVAVYCASVIT